MYSHHIDDRKEIKEYEGLRISEELKAGTHNPIPELATQKLSKARAVRRKGIAQGATVGFLGAVFLGTSLSLPPSLILVILFGSFTLLAGKGQAHYAAVKKAVNTNNFQPLLEDDELDDLDEYVKNFEPQTEEARQAKAEVTQWLNELCEPEELEDINTVNVQSTSVKTKEKPVDKKPLRTPLDAIKENPQGQQIKPERKEVEVVTEPEYPNNPWAAGGKLSTKTVQGEKVKTLTIPEDNFVDKIDQVADEAVKQKVDEKLMELELVQEQQGENLGKRIENVEKTVKYELTSIEKTLIDLFENFHADDGTAGENNGAAETAESLKPLDVLGSGAPLPSATRDSSGAPPVGIKLAFNTFNPEEHEQENEFNYFKALVELENLSPRGMPIIDRMWGVKSGGSKKCQAARERRDEFAQRMGNEIGDQLGIKLYGE